MKRHDIKSRIEKLNKKIEAAEANWFDDPESSEEEEHEKEFTEGSSHNSDSMNEHYQDEVNELKSQRDYYLTILLERQFESAGMTLPSRETHPEDWMFFMRGQHMLTPAAIERAHEKLRKEKRYTDNISIAKKSMWIGLIGALAALLVALVPILEYAPKIWKWIFTD